MLNIKTTGWQTWSSGSGNLKMLLTGRGGVGKTIFSSGAPSPIYANCEDGLASIADRGIPYADIHKNKDMLDLLSHLSSLEHIPKASRQYKTIVVDTIDSYQRKLMDQWMLDNRAAEFSGYGAYGWLSTQMNLLMTRLLNLDYNVIVIVHQKDKIVREPDGSEFREFEWQLAGSFKDTIANDFDLVGMIDTYYESDGEARVEKRGITFKTTPKRPFLKDRFGVLPEFLPIDFTADDWGRIWGCFIDNAKELPDVGVLEEVPDAEAAAERPLTPEAASGPMPPAARVEEKLSDLTKPDLMAKCKELGIPTRNNLLKGELITLLENHEKAAGKQADTAPVSEPVSEQRPMPVEQLAHELKAEIIADNKPAEPEPQPQQQSEQTSMQNTPAPAAASCADCKKDISSEKVDILKLSAFKFRRTLCASCYAAAKAAAN